MKVSLRPCGSYHALSAPCAKCATLPPDRRMKERRRQQGRKPERAK